MPLQTFKASAVQSVLPSIYHLPHDKKPSGYRQTDRLPWWSGPRPLFPCWLWAPWAPAPPVYPHRSLPPWLIYQITHTKSFLEIYTDRTELVDPDKHQVRSRSGMRAKLGTARRKLLRSIISTTVSYFSRQWRRKSICRRISAGVALSSDHLHISV